MNIANVGISYNQTLYGVEEENSRGITRMKIVNNQIFFQNGIRKTHCVEKYIIRVNLLHITS